MSSPPSSLAVVRSATDLGEQCAGSAASAAVLLFGADWHEACPMLETVLGALAPSYRPDSSSSSSRGAASMLFGTVDAEAAADLSESYGVTMVPTVLLLLPSGSGAFGVVSERLEGEDLANPSALTLAVQRLAKAASAGGGTGSGGAPPALTETTGSGAALGPGEDLDARLEKLVRMDTVVLFMKGTPDKPRCGFSRQAVELLADQKISTYASFDILADEAVRQGLKKYSDWPTYPQIYVRGELMGGLDIMKETAAEGSLLDDWDLRGSEAEAGASASESLNDRLAALVRRHPVMLFMKGLPSNPRCGFSRQIVELLDSIQDDGGGISYDSFDILGDDSVRQGLKEYSDWPTFPQLYVNGDLIGGLDIVRELHESGELVDTLREGQ